MSGPGSGRYTKYVPVASPRNEMLSKLFNSRADAGKGEIYGAAYQTDPVKAAAAAVATATAKVVNGVGGILPVDGFQTGDTDTFPTGVKTNYSGAPNLNDVAWDTATSTFGGPPSNAGGPANPYTPDLSSPGPGKTSGTQKDIDPKITTSDIKPNYVAGAPDTGTVSPSATASLLGTTPIGSPLVKGKSSV